MVEVLLLSVAGVIMLKAYSGTKRPVLYSVINMLLGAAALLSAGLFTGAVPVTLETTAASLILGVPAVSALYLLSVFLV